MLELDNYPKSVFEKLNLTPEEARDNAIRVLESVRFNRDKLADYMKDVNELDSYEWEIIADIARREDVVRSFAAQFPDGLAQAYHASLLEMYLTTD